MSLIDRDLRQRDLIPPVLLAACRATVAGVGAIGRQVCLQLAAMGVPRLQLIDHDQVEVVNLAPQGYLEDDVGRHKVHATADLCQEINHQLEVHAEAQRFRASMEVGNVLFCCVDSIQTRRHIWEAVRSRVECFIDGRMAAEVVRVLTVTGGAGAEAYAKSLFPQAEALPQPCTARSTIYCANVAAGLMVSQFAKWLRVIAPPMDVTLNLLAMDWTVVELAET